MFTRLSAPALIAIALLATGTSLAQANLSAKVSKYQPVSTPAESDRVKDGLLGPVRRVRTEVVKLVAADGRIMEGKRTLLEVVAYDVKGNKIENQYFPVAGATLTGKETYKYDDKGNISEMVLLNDDGSLLSKENYKYEFDFAGNWNKMVTSVAVIDSGKLSFEPSEITYRSIMYYLDENMVKMATASPAGPAATQPNAAPATEIGNVAKNNAEPKSQPSVEPLPINKPGAATKAAQLLPAVSVSTDKINSGNPVEVKNVASNSAAAPRIVIDEPPPTAPASPASTSTPPAPKPILRPISGGVLNGSAIFLPAPVYPETAKRMRTAGVVVVEVVIDESGKVISATAENGPPTLREAAIKAALRARFSPTKLSGQPVKVFGTISYKFSLSQ